MARMTPQQIAQKHGENLKRSISQIEQGVRSVQESPGVSAARKIDKMRAGWLKAMDEGKIEAGLTRFTLGEWQQAMLQKGTGRIAAGVDAALPKTTQFFAELTAYQDAGLAGIRNMPDVSESDAKARMNAWFDHMKKFRRSR